MKPKTFQAAMSHEQIGPLLLRYAAHYAKKYTDHCNPHASAAFATEDAWNTVKHCASVNSMVEMLDDDLAWIGA